MNFYRMPSKFAQDNLLITNQMGEFCLKDFIVDRETFPYNIFLYIKSGTFYVEQYGKKFKLKAGDCIMIRMSDKHLYYSDKTDVADFFWMHFQGNALTSLLEKLAKNNCLPIIIHSEDFGKELCNCYNIAIKNQSDYEYVISAKIYEIFIRFSGSYLAEIDLKNIDDFPDFIKASLHYIEHHIYEKISLTKLAKHVHIDKFYLIQQFSKYLNTTPIKYICQKKINIASDLLSTSDASINEISQRLGFFDQSHFNKIFKQNIGISPSNYRKTNIRKSKSHSNK
ncbi:MAG: AraC family transcriptional regulator [Clostridia bacterium]